MGGLWDEIGDLQFEFLKAHGLRPDHRLLDVGCGALRGGVRFVRHLHASNYYGVDISQDLLDSGYVELEKAGLADKLPRGNLHCSADFDFLVFGKSFEYSIAQSLFTHLNLNRIRRCLEQINDVLADGGTLFATFFERPASQLAREDIRHQPGDKTSHDITNPYHYTIADLRHAAAELPLDVSYIGDWGHPRAQQMIAFRRRPRT